MTAVDIGLLVLHQGCFDGALVGWGEFANPNTMTAQFVGVPTVTPTYGTYLKEGMTAVDIGLLVLQTVTKRYLPEK
jgi:hypothetical protein